MIVALRTDSPSAELYLYDGSVQVTSHVWEAHRTLARDLLATLAKLCDDNHSSLSAVTGVIVYKGPGSFTGLRIGCTVANTIAYSQAVPIVGVSGDQWLQDGRARLERGDNDGSVIPDYGAEPRITSPQK